MNNFGDMFFNLERDNISVQNNYYFVLGDNRANSSDSRFWGILSQRHLIGTAKMVLFSIDKYSTKALKIRLNRFFLGIK